MNQSEELFTSEMEEINRLFPDARIPPNCFTWMNVRVISYDSRRMVKIQIPVTEQMLNPMMVMQGGFISAAFDNAFGPLSYAAAKKPCSTLEMHTQYIRSIAAGEMLTVEAKVVSRGTHSLHIAGEAHNSQGKLIATSGCTMIIMR